MAGQSNMAGRGISRPAIDTISYPNIYSLNKDSVWLRAKNPLHWDKPEAAVGMGITFAHELALKLGGNLKIGLVPCAAGGTTIDQWLNNSYFAFSGNFYLYDNLIKRAKIASKSGIVVGMIWHQGESDATNNLYPTYQNKLKAVFQKIREDLNNPNLAIVAGELGTYLGSNTSCPRWDSINASINQLKSSLSYYDVVSSTGLTPNSDNTHFTSASQTTFGSRYADTFYKIAFLETGVRDEFYNSTKEVSINYSNGVLTVTNCIDKKTSCEVLDLLGRRIAFSSANYIHKIPIYKKGVHFVRVQDDTNIYSKQIALY